MDRTASPIPDALALGLPERFERCPFAYESCRVDVTPSAAEQAAYSAYHRACRSAEGFWDGAPAADWMLDLLRKLWDRLPSAPDDALRRFALLCAESLETAATPTVQVLLEVLRRHVAGAATLEDLGALQARTHRHAAQGGVQGLPRCSPDAAAMLAAWHAADRDPWSAASWTTEFAARHDAFVVLARHAAAWHSSEDRGEPWRESWRVAFFAEAHPEVEAAALADARKRQADLLRACLPKPFGGKIRGEVFFGAADPSGHEPVYCMTCGSQRGDVTPGVLFDVRGLLCAACGKLVSRCVH
jgi:hypothetical protein